WTPKLPPLTQKRLEEPEIRGVGAYGPRREVSRQLHVPAELVDAAAERRRSGCAWGGLSGAAHTRIIARGGARCGREQGSGGTPPRACPESTGRVTGSSSEARGRGTLEPVGVSPGGERRAQRKGLRPSLGSVSEGHVRAVAEDRRRVADI